MNILFVEDDRDTRDLTTALLRNMGHEVIDVSTAEVALGVLRGVTPIEAIVVDVGLPGMQGDLFAAEARCLRYDVRIVFTTGHREMRAPADDPIPPVLLKPYSVEEIEAALVAQR
jgi:DNA-binding response OmpR family regulator